MTIHSVQCTWNAYACAVENARDAIAEHPDWAYISSTHVEFVADATGYQADGQVTCDVDCVNRQCMVTWKENNRKESAGFLFNSAHWTDSGALHELLCTNSPGDSYSVKFAPVA